MPSRGQSSPTYTITERQLMNRAVPFILPKDNLLSVVQKAETQKEYLRVSVAQKRHHDRGNSYKGNHLIEAAAYSSEV